MNNSPVNIEPLFPEQPSSGGSASDSTAESVPGTTPFRSFVETRTDSAPKPRGYLLRSSEQAVWPPAGLSGPGFEAPRPLPKRPTGRVFIGAVLASICALGAWTVWDNFLSTSAYGVVKSDTLLIRSEWDGALSKLYVVEGQDVKKGALLATLESRRLGRELDRLRDRLRVEEAKHDSMATVVLTNNQSHNAEYLQQLGALQRHREELTRIQGDLARIATARETNAVSAQEYDRVAFLESGQRELVEKMTAAVEELRDRSSMGATNKDQRDTQLLRPTLARIEYLKGQISRIKARIADGEIRSPVNGTVVRIQPAIGQNVSDSDTIMEVMDRDSIRIELYIPQEEVDAYPVGKELELSVEPNSTRVRSTIIASRKQFELAPDALRRHYTGGQTLMPLILKPVGSSAQLGLSAGAIVREEFLQGLGWNSMSAKQDASTAVAAAGEA